MKLTPIVVLFRQKKLRKVISVTGVGVGVVVGLAVGGWVGVYEEVCVGVLVSPGVGVVVGDIVGVDVKSTQYWALTEWPSVMLIATAPVPSGGNGPQPGESYTHISEPAWSPKSRAPSKKLAR